jgi:hypothetical protein
VLGLVSRRAGPLALLACALTAASAAAFDTAVPLPSELPLRVATGTRTHANEHNRYAVDLLAPAGTPVVAGFDGVVRAVERGCAPLAPSSCAYGWGNYVLLEHRDGTCAMHAHLASVAVTEGARVARGAPLGTVGASGAASGPHLHYDRMRCDSRLSLPWSFHGEAATPTSEAASGAPAAKVGIFTPTFALRRGRVMAVSRIAGLQRGATVTLRCVRACARRVRVTVRAARGPERTRIAIPGGLRLRRSTVLELRVRRAGMTPRAVRYRFPGGTRVEIA